jgi:hypothetical protein
LEVDFVAFVAPSKKAVKALKFLIFVNKSAERPIIRRPACYLIDFPNVGISGRIALNTIQH